LGSPQVRPENLVADSGWWHSTIKEGRPDVAHKRQWAAREDLDIVRKLNIAQVHVALARPGVALIEELVPGVGTEVVDLTAEMEHRVSQSVVRRSAVGVGNNDGALGLRTRDLFDDWKYRRYAGARAGQ
jgi:hypothetical protein